MKRDVGQGGRPSATRLSATPASTGSASVLVIGLIAVSVSLIAATGAVGHALAERVALDGAADATALAAADALAGFVFEEPCDVAQRAASLNDVRLVACRIDGAEVAITVGINVMGIATTSRARAGPPS